MAKFVLLKYPQSVLDTLPLERIMPPDDQIGLTQSGKSTAEQIAVNLAGNIDGDYFIWSSPAFRCVETAQIIGARLGRDPNVDVRLDERRLFYPSSDITVREFRSRQERGYLDPSRPGNGEQESPFAHRPRIEGWLAEILGKTKSNDVHVIVSHGAVIEHLHSAIGWKPSGAMISCFTFCAPGHAHLWGVVELPDDRKIWCCLGANVNLVESASFEAPFSGFKDLNGLAVDLASDPRFQKLIEATAGKETARTDDVYYIR